MNLTQAFSFTNTIALSCWLALIFLPRRDFMINFIKYGIITVFSLFYFVMILLFAFRVQGGGFGSLAEVRLLFSTDAGLLAGWVHYLAFDLFIGLWIVKAAQGIGLNRFLQGIILLLTFMFGPIGLVIFYACKSVNNKTVLINNRKTLIFGMTFVGALLLPSLIAYYYDERLLNGISVWVKPLKFQFSEIMLIATILIAFSLIEPAKQDTSLLKIGVNLVVVCGILEVLYIMLQAARGVASHYNNSTKLEAIMYPIMGVGAILMVVGAFIVGYVIFRTPKSEQFEGFRLGSALGLMLGAVFTLITAGILSGNVGGHWVGGIKSDIGGVPFLGWSRTGGDLRVAHFFATHLMQVLPILGLISMKLKQENQRKVIFAGSLVGIGVVLFTLWQAKQGLSFF